jgi:hypothetical protein
MGNSLVASSKVKLVVFVPVADAEKVMKAIGQAGAGHIGEYTDCSFSIEGIGRFIPGERSKPTIGQKCALTEVKEIRIETICDQKDIDKIIEKLVDAHSYEEPGYDIYPLLEHKKKLFGFRFNLLYIFLLFSRILSSYIFKRCFFAANKFTRFIPFYILSRFRIKSLRSIQNNTFS